MDIFSVDLVPLTRQFSQEIRQDSDLQDTCYCWTRHILKYSF